MHGVSFSSVAFVSWYVYHNEEAERILLDHASYDGYFLLSAFFHGDHAGMHYAGDTFGHGPGEIP